MARASLPLACAFSLSIASRLSSDRSVVAGLAERHIKDRAEFVAPEATIAWLNNAARYTRE